MKTTTPGEKHGQDASKLHRVGMSATSLLETDDFSAGKANHAPMLAAMPAY